jgi:hypothetical protein
MKRGATLVQVDPEVLWESWLEEDSRRQGGLESWEQSKRDLDRDRPAGRPLFP